MLNQIVLVGRVANEMEIKEVENKKLVTLTLAVPRSYKNADGVYDTDFIKCTLWNSMAENTAEYVKKGDLVGIKGRLQTEEINGFSITNVIAEKVTFLSSSRSNSEV